MSKVKNSSADPIAAMIDAEELHVRRMLPEGLSRRPLDLYVTQKTSFEAQLSRAQALLEVEGGGGVVWIHGLGAAQPRAVNLALTLAQRNLGRVQVAPFTNSTDCLDLIDDGGPPSTQVRCKAAVHIKVFRVGS